MKIWKLKEDLKNSEGLIVEDKELRNKYIYPNFNGQVIQSWDTIKVKTANKEKGADQFIFLASSPVFSPKAVGVLQPLLENNTQTLPLTYNDSKEIFIINVIKMIDGLDTNQSVVSRLKNGNIMSIKKAVFKKDRIEGQHIFKLHDCPKNPIFVSDTFKETVEQAGLKGFRFEEVWNSDDTEVKAREARYATLLEEIEQMEGKLWSFDDAIRHLNQNRSMAFVSKGWKLQVDEEGDLLIGSLQHDGTYKFIVSVYYPPILFSYEWKQTALSEVRWYD